MHYNKAFIVKCLFQIHNLKYFSWFSTPSIFYVFVTKPENASHKKTSQPCRELIDLTLIDLDSLSYLIIMELLCSQKETCKLLSLHRFAFERN